ncbi:MAG: adenylosuccinate lyase [Synergistaceae bacterium]|nr:adenylosuccinate lyase [Synergistaceae bacterium]MBR0095809.1 adenylosuccinate lyase [Synergistaceae bacterium]MBR0220846.1 adenylosuccinate lyase [Synergistaceae bacterium]
MIARYSEKDIAALWDEENRLKIMLDVELAVAKAWCELGRIPKYALDDILTKAAFTVERVQEIEKKTQHDVVAFVSAVAENVGPSGKYLHLGMTSSDILDTASSIMLRDSLIIILDALKNLDIEVLKLAKKYQHLPCIGRTHGIHAEPMSLGLKFLNWHSELKRDKERLELAMAHVSVGKISGAVGTYAMSSPELEAKVCELLNLTPAKVSNQILQRDRHAEILNALAIFGSSLERIALEIRHLQRTEVQEAFEPFGVGQKGSSAMPHKRNPIKCERICGMARLLRGYALTGMENIALWHERDISHSSTERVIWPDALNIAAFMTRSLTKILKGLTVDENRVKSNLDLTGGLVYSQRVLTFLLDELNFSREAAYAIVQENAMKTAQITLTPHNQARVNFLDMLLSDERVKDAVEPEKIKELFENNFYLRYVDEIFNRFAEDFEALNIEA